MADKLADWDDLVYEKKHAQALAQLQASSHPVCLRTPTRLLRRASLVQTLQNAAVGSSASLARFRAAVARTINELRIERQLKSLSRTDRRQGGNADQRAVAELRLRWRHMQSVVFEKRFSDSLRSKFVRLRATSISLALSAEILDPPAEVYEDLLKLVSTIWLYPIPQDVQHQVWDILVRELSKDTVRHLVTALDGDHEHAVVILRSVAVCRLSGWKLLPTDAACYLKPTSQALSLSVSVEDLPSTPQNHTLTTGFYDLVHGLLVRCPSLVHEAFDSAHLQLLWPSTNWVGEYLYERVGYGEVTNTLDELSRRLHRFPKLMDVDLQRDMQCLVLYIATAEGTTLLADTVRLILDSVAVLAQQRDANALPSEKKADAPLTAEALCNTMSGLDAGELVHPTLPILLFAAHLLRQSPAAAEAMLEGGFLETLRQLWLSDFAVPSGMSTGQWVPAEKRVAAMRIVCCIVLGAFAEHAALRVLLAAFVVSSEEMAAWFWDVAAHALCAYVNKSDARAERWEGWCKSVGKLAMQVMREERKMPADSDCERRLEDPESLVWIFQTSGDAMVDLKLRDFSLDCLLRLAARPTLESKETLRILGGCDARNVRALEQALSLVIERCMSGTMSPSLDTLKDLATSRNLVMKNPLDRLAMLLANASRRNPFVAQAFSDSGAREFIVALQDGQFDQGRPNKFARAWRRRTCRDIELRLQDTA